MPLSQRLHACCAGIGAGAAAPFRLPGTERKYERSRPFQITHLALDLTLDFSEKRVSGTATLSFERIDPDATALELDAVGFDLRRVTLITGKRRARVEPEYDGDRLRVPVGRARSGRVQIAYAARPRRGLYFLGPDEAFPDRPEQVWTQCQDEDARHWFPCHDKPHVKMTTELAVTVPAGFTALSNGERVAAERPRGKKRPWSYRFELDSPHPSYLVTLVAGRFARVEDRPAERPGAPPVPITYYVPPDREADARRSFGQTPRMVELFGRLTGVPYPFSRYSQVVVSDFLFGGMENTTATTMYEHILLDERAALDIESHDLVAHELAHQWFGNHVTCRDWSHAWLNEGFATFFEHLEREDRLGRDEYDYAVAGDLDAYLAEAGRRYTRPIVCRDYQEPIDLFDRHLYQKGGLVLHLLRRELGDALFWKGVHDYLTRNAGGVVETADLQRALERTSGRSLERFFDQWVYSPGHPALKVKIAWDDGLLTASVQQTQQGSGVPVFAFPLEVEVGLPSGTTQRFAKPVTERRDALVIKLPRRPAFATFDPDFRIAGAVTLEAPADLLRHQLARGKTARARWMAAEALARRHDPPTLEALGRTLAKTSEAWMVRSEAARALGRIGGDESQRLLEQHAAAGHPRVRRAVLAALGRFRNAAAAKHLQARVRRDPSYLVEAEAARALGATRQPGALRPLLAAIDDPSWADVKRAGVLDGLASLRDDAALTPILERTRYGIPSRGRRAAVVALARLSDSRRVREHLEDLLDDADPHLRASVIDALELLKDPRSSPALRRRLAREPDGRVARRLREALARPDLGAAAERKQLRDEVEELRRELHDLKHRVTRVEGSGKAARTGTRKKKAAR